MRTGLWKWLVIPALLFAAAVAHAEVFEKTLRNGLKVVVKEDHRAPVVVQQVWYKAGSIDEKTGTTGMKNGDGASWHYLKPTQPAFAISVLWQYAEAR